VGESVKRRLAFASASAESKRNLIDPDKHASLEERMGGV
jgi:hypothetical protein